MANSQASSFSNSQLSTINTQLSHQRLGRDSNPRCSFPHAGFQDRCLKPLGHPTDGDCNEYCIFLEIGWSTSGVGSFSRFGGNRPTVQNSPPLFWTVGPSLQSF